MKPSSLPGRTVKDFETAGEAAEVLLVKGVKNILVTHGKNGAYLFGGSGRLHISALDVPDSSVGDETGCGDQVTAITAACLAEGIDPVQAAKLGVRAGTLQFHRAGIQSVERDQLMKELES